MSDAREWLIKLQDDGKDYSSIHSIRGVVRPASQIAVNDDLIRKNPFEFQLATVVVNDSVTREAITRKQEREFLRFFKEDKLFANITMEFISYSKQDLEFLNFVVLSGMILNLINIELR